MNEATSQTIAKITKETLCFGIVVDFYYGNRFKH